MKRLIDVIDFSKMKVIYDKFIDLNKSICEQEMQLTEDMFQAEWNDYIIDIGWKPEIDCSGEFVTYLVKNANWDEPIFVSKTKNIQQLLVDVAYCISKIDFK